MDKKIKSGKEVIDEFFSEIYNIENIDEKTVEALISLYTEGKLTDKNIQNKLDELLQDELTPKQKKDE
jgi:Glu-tRNA(Gln) amidotransferase subunit E-like FAD-binding protein